MVETLKWSYILMDSQQESLLMKVGGDRYFYNRCTMRSHGIETVSLWVIQRTCDHEICGHSNSFSGI